MIRRVLAVLVVVIVVLLLIGDRLAVSAAQRAIAVKVRQAAQLSASPSVSIKGFPFLTQAVAGRYRTISVTAHDIHRGGVRIDTVHATFHGVHVSLRRALAGKVSEVPIDSSSGDLLLTYADLDAFLAKRKLTLRPSGTAVAVTGELLAGGVPVAASGTYVPAVSGTTLTFTPVAASLRLGGAAVSAAQLAAVTSALTLRIDLGDKLPFGLAVRQAHVLPTGVQIDASARGLVVPVPDDASQ